MSETLECLIFKEAFETYALEDCWILPTDKSLVESTSSSALEKLEIMDLASSSLSSMVLSSDDELNASDLADCEKAHRPGR